MHWLNKQNVCADQQLGRNIQTHRLKCPSVEPNFKLNPRHKTIILRLLPNHPQKDRISNLLVPVERKKKKRIPGSGMCSSFRKLSHELLVGNGISNQRKCQFFLKFSRDTFLTVSSCVRAFKTIDLRGFIFLPQTAVSRLDMFSRALASSIRRQKQRTSGPTKKKLCPS
jgi:hypothetical protein